MSIWGKLLELLLRKARKKLKKEFNEIRKEDEKVDTINEQLDAVDVTAEPATPTPELIEAAKPRDAAQQEKERKEARRKTASVEEIKRLKFAKHSMVFKTAHAGEPTERPGELVLVAPVFVRPEDIQLCGPKLCRSFQRYTGVANNDRHHYRIYDAHQKHFSDRRGAKGCYITIKGIRFDLKRKIGERSG